MNRRSRTVAVTLGGVACAFAFAVPASGADYTTHSELRVEAGGGDPPEPGRVFSNASIGVTASRFDSSRPDSGCGANGTTVQTRGPNALGIVGHAGRVNEGLQPLRTLQFSSQPGLGVCRIGGFTGFASSFWSYNVNHEFGTIAADQRPVGRADQVLWYYVECLAFDPETFECTSGRNSGRELGLRAPARAEPGNPFTVTAFAYSALGNPRPQAGIEVFRDDGTLFGVTNADGEATGTLASTTELRASRDARGDIPSEPLEVCVNEDLSQCPAKRGEDFVGTNRSDRIMGTDGADTIRPRDDRDVVVAGDEDDFVGVIGGGRDNVDCGAGRDQVQAGPTDRLAANCEERL